MDLRGFGKEHRGCKFELVWLLGEIPLEREVFFVDRVTRIDEFKAILFSTWNKLPAFSPNRELDRPELRLFQVEDSGKALQPLLAWLFAAAA